MYVYISAYLYVCTCLCLYVRVLSERIYLSVDDINPRLEAITPQPPNTQP